MKDDGLIERLRNIFVSTDIFNLRIGPLEKLLYGTVAMILIAAMSFWISLIIKK